MDSDTSISRVPEPDPGRATARARPGTPPHLLDRVRQAVRALHYSPRTEKTYVFWIRRYILFHRKRHPSEMGDAEVREFLSALATRGKVSASTQNQALSAILFLYRRVLRQEIGWVDGIIRAKRPVQIPVVLTRDEVRAVLTELRGVPWIMASLLYGCGLRLLECARLRVKDVDLSRCEITVRDGKGQKDRIALLPRSVRGPLETHLKRVHRPHQDDLAQGLGGVEIPTALERKYPRAPWEWSWQWVFPASRPYRDGDTGRLRRHHLHESALQRAVREAVLRAGIPKKATCHTLRHHADIGITATASPPTCSRTGMTSGPSRSYSATPTSARRWSTPMC